MKSHIKTTPARKVFVVVNGLIMLGISIASLYPLYYVLVASLSNSNDLLRYGSGVLLWPINFTFDAYIAAFQNKTLLTGYGNTLFILVVGTTISLILSALGAFLMSQKQLMFRRIITKLIMFTMFFSGGLIPFYLTVRDLHLVDSIWSLIIPTAINTYNMIILRMGFEAVPSSLLESARLDGATNFYILFRIVLPLAKASLAVIALYYAVGYWNAWFNASIFLQGDNTKWPLQLVLRQILIENDQDNMMSGINMRDQIAIGESIKHAVTMIATVPILCLYPFIQKYFMKGVLLGAVKE